LRVRVAEGVGRGVRRIRPKARGDRTTVATALARVQTRLTTVLRGIGRDVVRRLEGPVPGGFLGKSRHFRAPEAGHVVPTGRIDGGCTREGRVVAVRSDGAGGRAV